MPALLDIRETPFSVSETIAEARAVDGKPGRFLIQLINPGWGSSGYYSSEVLEAAGKAKIFRAGTHMYLDHPTESEEYERPERSLRDLVAVLTEDAYWDGGALVAEAAVFPGWREVLKDMAGAIGVSIRAAAKVTEGGTAEGRRGRIINELVEATSVDFVTKAGRGGRILQVLESTRAQLSEARNVGDWIESRLHRELTCLADDMFGEGYLTREERLALSSAVGAGLDSFHDALSAAQPGLYERDPYADPNAQTTAEEGTPNVPAARPDDTTTESHKEIPMGDKTIEESEYTRLVEAAGRVETLEAELNKAKTALEEATKKPEDKPLVTGPRAQVQEHIQRQDSRIAELEARESARDVVNEVLADAWLGEAQKARIRSELMKELPMVEDKLDEAKLRTRATDLVNATETEAAEILDAAGFGKPRGLGALTTPATEAATKQISASLAESLGDAFGLSESAAEIAVKGR